MLVTLNNITKDYAGTPVLEDLSLQIGFSDKVGIVGVNGSGKSTLLKIIEGRENIQKGERFIAKGTKIGYLEQLPTQPAEITVYEVLQTAFEHMIEMMRDMKKLEAEMSNPDSFLNEKEYERTIMKYGQLQTHFEQNGGYEIESKIDSVANGIGIAQKYAQRYYDLSGGEQTKVTLAKLLLQEPDLLLLDEPTNHLDVKAIEWLEQFIKSYEKTVVIVSHDRYFLDKTVLKIFDVEEGEVDVYVGNYSSFLVQKEQRLLAQFEEYKEQQRKIEKMEAAIKRMKQWAIQGDNDAMHKRAKAMQKALDRIVRIDRPVLEHKKMALKLDVESRSGKDVVVLEQLSKAFDRPLFNGINGLIRYGEKVCLVGENGVGKTTLIELILQKLSPDHGVVKLGSQVKVGYLPQHVIFKDESLTILEQYREEVPVLEGEARHRLAKFLFYGQSVFKRCKDLSGGEKNRLRLAQLMAQETNFLIFDEPTNHLDIQSREVLEEVLKAYPGTVLSISHDRFFINETATHIWEIRDGGLFKYSGNYDDYRQEREKQMAREEASIVSETPKQSSMQASQPSVKPKLQHMRDPKLVEEKLMLLETRKEEIETAFLDEELLRNGAAIQQLKQELEQVNKEIDELYAIWTD